MSRRIKTIIIYSLFSWLCLFFVTTTVWAQQVNSVTGANNDLQFTPQVSIPGSEFVANQGTTVSQDTSTICNYLIAIYKYLIGTVAIFAAVALIIGGVIWITAAGSPGRIGVAKSWIAGALSGLALALSAFLILATINPELVICRHLKIDNIKNITSPKGSTTTASDACKWRQHVDKAEQICPTGFIKKANSFCKGLGYHPDPLKALTIFPDVNSVIDYCCCADNSTLEQNNFCKTADEGATCRIASGWGYCEHQTCRPCKEKLADWLPATGTPSDLKNQAKTLPDKYKCYHNNSNFECPDKKGICGDMAFDNQTDCNSNAGGITTGVSCWDINDWTNLSLGTFFVQCRCE